MRVAIALSVLALISLSTGLRHAEAGSGGNVGSTPRWVAQAMKSQKSQQAQTKSTKSSGSGSENRKAAITGGGGLEVSSATGGGGLDTSAMAGSGSIDEFDPDQNWGRQRNAPGPVSRPQRSTRQPVP